jgi:hypothetical protein
MSRRHDWFDDRFAWSATEFNLSGSGQASLSTACWRAGELPAHRASRSDPAQVLRDS